MHAWRRTMASNQDLFDLFHRKLREMWFAEKKIHASLPKMANAAQSDALRAAFKKHEADTQRQMSRLGTIFGLIDRSAKEEASIALTALLDECMEAAVKFKNSSALDAALIAGASCRAPRNRLLWRPEGVGWTAWDEGSGWPSRRDLDRGKGYGRGAHAAGRRHGKPEG